MESEKFLVAALGDDGAWTTPVRVRCIRCQTFSPPYGGVNDDPREPPTGEAPLDALNAWAAQHVCSPALSADAWAAAGQAIREYLLTCHHSVTVDDTVKAFALALQAVWEDVQKAARDLYPAPARRTAGGPLDAAEALLRVTLYALEDDVFRDEWDRCVRDAADSICAQIAGQRMAGATSGELEWDFELPVPDGMDDMDAARAFNQATGAAVNARLAVMKTDRGGLG